MNVKKIICLLLAALMLFAALCTAACGNNGSETETTSANADTTAQATEPVETNTLERSGLEIRDLTGKTLDIWYSTVSAWSPYPLAVTDEEANTGDIVMESGFKRNQFLEQTLKLTINYTQSKSDPNASGANADLALLRGLNSSGDIGEFEIVMTGATPAAQLALENFYLDIRDSKYIKSDAEYYESQVNKQLLFYDHQYFAAGFYSVMNTGCIDVTFVNTDIVNNTTGLTTGDLYDLALNRKWTLEKMIELGQPYCTLDTNTGDIYSDHYGLILSRNYCQNIYYDLGGTVVEYVPADKALVSTLNNDSNMAVWSYMEQNVRKTKGVMLVPNDKHLEAFKQQAAPFMLVTYKNLTQLSDVNFDWVLLPTPLMQEGGEFHAYSDAWNLNFAGIPAQTRDSDLAEYLYEAFMCTSYDYVYPAYYELSFGTRYQPDATGAIVFDLMNHSRTICLSNIFSIASSMQSVVTTVFDGGSYASNLKGIVTIANAKLKKLNEQFH